MTSTLSVWETWRAVFPDCAPVGYALRNRFGDRWLRIHSLPSGARLPRTEAERAEFLFRHNVAATVLLGLHGDSSLFVTTWNKTHAGSVPSWCLDEEMREEFAGATTETRSVRWHPHRFDDLLLEVASGDGPQVCYFSGRTRVAYCPYDGGADLFVSAAEDLVALRLLLAPWRSPLESGL